MLTYFYLKKIKVSKFSGNSLLRRALNIWPAFEKIRSDGTDVAGTIAYFSAISPSGCKADFCWFQKLNILHFNSWWGIFKYYLIKAVALLVTVLCDWIVVTFDCRNSQTLSTCSGIICSLTTACSERKQKKNIL